ncbi:hypothetical protein MASR1M12_24630 [Erysipelotrichia bacterium]
MPIKKLNVPESFPRFEFFSNILLLAISEEKAAPFDMEWFDYLIKPDALVSEYFRTTISPLPNKYRKLITLKNISAALKKLTPEKIEIIRKDASFLDYHRDQ